MSNSDKGGSLINNMIKNYVTKNKTKSIFFKSLGQKMYFSIICNSDLVLGNSSSGIIETPILKKPSIDIGDRQLGRVKCFSTLFSKPNSKTILRSINKAYSKKFLNSITKMNNPYVKDNTSKKIFNVIKIIKFKNLINKNFYNIK